MLRAYAEMLPVLHAERQLAAIEAASVPHLTEDAARGVFSRYQETAGRDQRPRRATLADLARMGFNVKTVPRKEVGADGGD